MFVQYIIRNCHMGTLLVSRHYMDSSVLVSKPHCNHNDKELFDMTSHPKLTVRVFFHVLKTFDTFVCSCSQAIKLEKK